MKRKEFMRHFDAIEENFIKLDSHFQGQKYGFRFSPNAETALHIFRTFLSVVLFGTICKLTHLKQKIMYDVRVNQSWLHAYYFQTVLFLLFYAFLFIKLRILRPANRKIPVEKWDKVAPVPMYTSSCCLIAAIICFIMALWPAFHIMTFIIGFVGLAAFVSVIQWLPF